MNIKTRKILDKSFTAVAYSSLAFMTLAVAVFMLPIIINGSNAFMFNATIEHNKFICENLGRGENAEYSEMLVASNKARAPLYKMFYQYEHSPKAAECQKQIEASRDAAMLEILNNKTKLEDIFLKSDRTANLKDFSRQVWQGYLQNLENIFRQSQRDGSSYSLSEILKSQEQATVEAVKTTISKMGLKLSFSQRNALRRALVSMPNVELNRMLELLDEENASYNSFKRGVAELLGPENDAQKETLKLMRQKYGQPRMDLARAVFDESIAQITIHKTDSQGNETAERVKTAEYFKSTPVVKMLDYIENNFDAMMQPHYTVYWGFFFDNPYDSNIFGGIWPMILGTFYLTIGSMIIAAPLGIIAAIYFAEYAKPSPLISFLRMCVGTLAGVPSIVFGLFGLAFLINTLKISESKSVLAGSITLALLILPTIIRSCEEALKTVPNTYREAALGLGAGKWKSICTVILPSALPAMLTGIIISMGRAAGETAPIIFTAATSTGAALGLSEIFTQATPALPWNIYNICSEHEMAERVAHVQYGMVLTLIAIVLTLNFAAIALRARMRKRIKI